MRQRTGEKTRQEIVRPAPRRRGHSLKQHGLASRMPRRLCGHEGCDKQAKIGGGCIRHGAVVVKKRCDHEGCDNVVVQGGVCVHYSAVTKRCRHEGCDNKAQRGELCFAEAHGARPVATVPGDTRWGPVDLPATVGPPDWVTGPRWLPPGWTMPSTVTPAAAATRAGACATRAVRETAPPPACWVMAGKMAGAAPPGVAFGRRGMPPAWPTGPSGAEHCATAAGWWMTAGDLTRSAVSRGAGEPPRAMPGGPSMPAVC